MVSNQSTINSLDKSVPVISSSENTLCKLIEITVIITLGWISVFETFQATAVGDEGGFAPNFQDNKEGIS